MNLRRRPAPAPAETIRPVRWLVGAYLGGLLTPVALALLSFHPGYGLLLTMFALPLLLIGTYSVIAVRRVFLYPDALADLTPHRLLLVFAVPVGLYFLIMAGKLTLLLISFTAHVL